MKHKTLMIVADFLITFFLLTTLWATYSMTHALKGRIGKVNYFAARNPVPAEGLYRVNVTTCGNLTVAYYLELPEPAMPLLLKGRYPDKGECVVTPLLYSQIKGDKLNLGNLTCEVSGVVSMWRAVNASRLVMVRSRGSGFPIYVIRLDPQQIQVIESHPELVSLALPPTISAIAVESSLGMLNSLTTALTAISLVSSVFLSFIVIKHEELGKWALKTAMGKSWWWTSLQDVTVWALILSLTSLAAYQLTATAGKGFAELLLGLSLSDVWTHVPLLELALQVLTFPVAYLTVGAVASTVGGLLPLSRSL